MADGTGGINNSSRVCGQFFISTMCWLKSGSNTVQQCKHDIDRQRTGGHHHCRKWTFNIFCPARDLQRTVDTFCHLTVDTVKTVETFCHLTEFAANQPETPNGRQTRRWPKINVATRQKHDTRGCRILSSRNGRNWNR